MNIDYSSVQAIKENPAQQYVILFRDNIAKKFRAVYAFDPDSDTTKVRIRMPFLS